MEPISRILEQGVRLSQSKIWDYQSDFYKSEGVAAWEQNIVPSYITNNPFLANTYATAVFHFAKDYRKTKRNKIYILELGSGTGKFAFYFIRALSGLLKGSEIEDLDFALVMSDYSKANISFWQNHPSLQLYVQKGVLDFCEFDAGKTRLLNLTQSGEKIDSTSDTPIICIANYFFDSLPQDAFKIEDRKVYESLCKLIVSEKTPASATGFDELRLEYQHQETDPLSYYSDQALNELLNYYRDIAGPTHLTIPVVAIECIRLLHSFSNGHLIVLTADKGYADLASLMLKPEPAIERHGSISMAVNYDAIYQLLFYGKGTILSNDFLPEHINVLAFMSQAAYDTCPDLEILFLNQLEHMGPDDFYTLRSMLLQNTTYFQLSHIAMLLRFAHYDPNTFITVLPLLHQCTEKAPDVDKTHWKTILRKTWENHYPLDKKDDLAFLLGTAAMRLACYELAVDFFTTSIQLNDTSNDVYHNMAYCLMKLDKIQAAEAAIEKALSLESSNEASLHLKEKIAAIRKH